MRKQAPKKKDETYVIDPADIRQAGRDLLQGYVGYIVRELEKEGMPTDVAFAEPIIHELCHGAVFQMNLSGGISGLVSDRFNKIKFNKRSDVSECMALAVEKVVFDRLQWPLSWNRIVEFATDNMHYFKNSHDTQKEVDRQLQRKITKKRADQVMHWLQQLVKEHA